MDLTITLNRFPDEQPNDNQVVLAFFDDLRVEIARFRLGVGWDLRGQQNTEPLDAVAHWIPGVEVKRAYTERVRGMDNQLLFEVPDLPAGESFSVRAPAQANGRYELVDSSGTVRSIGRKVRR